MATLENIDASHQDLSASPASTLSVEPFVTIENLVIRRGATATIEIPQLELVCGTTALVGPNGSGKSTLLHLVAGLLEPTSGRISVFGMEPKRARSRVGYVLQNQGTSPHLPVTAREVVSLGRSPSVGPFRRLTRQDRLRVDEAMERLEVAELADRQMSEMSGGQRQRVLVAQGIAQGADLLLLDEPIAGVDIASIATISRVIDEERAKGRAVVVATHDLAEANGYDCVVLMAGRLVASGRASDVLTIGNLRRAYAGRLLDVGDVDLVIDDGSHHDHVHDDG